MCNLKAMHTIQGDMVGTLPGVSGAGESPFNEQFMTPKADLAGYQTWPNVPLGSMTLRKPRGS